VTEEAIRRPATSVYPTEAGRSEASLLGVGRGIGSLRWSSQGCVEAPRNLFRPRIRQSTKKGR
jgi:hypothetical protein